MAFNLGTVRLVCPVALNEYSKIIFCEDHFLFIFEIVLTVSNVKCSYLFPWNLPLHLPSAPQPLSTFREILVLMAPDQREQMFLQSWSVGLSLCPYGRGHIMCHSTTLSLPQPAACRLGMFGPGLGCGREPAENPSGQGTVWLAGWSSEALLACIHV